jgi:hypothetical protein
MHGQPLRHSRAVSDREMKSPNLADLLWNRVTYWNFIRSEAELRGSDGCSAVTGVHVEHDAGYYYGKDPRDAYFRFRGGALDPWEMARPITRAEVDKRFRQCLMNRSTLGRWSPMAYWRWLGVRVGGAKAWDSHRQHDAAIRTSFEGV